MTSRERIMTALDHREPDRVPIDFGGHRSSGIAAQAYVRLRRHLGLPPSPLYVYDFIQQLAIVEDDVLDLVGADVVEVGNGYQHKPDYWKEWQLPDGTPCPTVLTEADLITFLRLNELGISNPSGTLRYYREKGKLSATRIGGRNCYTVESAMEFLAAMTGEKRSQ